MGKELKDFYMNVLKGYFIMTLATILVYGFTWKAFILYPIVFGVHFIVKDLKIAIAKFTAN